MNDNAGEAHRSRLLAIAYNMTGSRTDAEDIVQETLMRWLAVDRSKVRSERAFLTTIVTRLSLNHLRARRAKREDYPGDWLPEPTDTGEPSHDERLDAISFGFLTMLERLSPLQRAVFVLRSGFELDYAEIAAIVDRDETACRKTFSRARAAIRSGKQRHGVSVELHHALLTRFMAAADNGDVEALAALLSDDVVMRGDGGRDSPALKRPLCGTDAVARFIVASPVLLPPDATPSIETLNGRPAAILRVNGRPILAVLIECSDEEITEVFVIANAQKLARLCRFRPVGDRL